MAIESDELIFDIALLCFMLRGCAIELENHQVAARLTIESYSSHYVQE